MTKSDWLEVGLKLLGVYFAALGFTSAFLLVVGYGMQQVAKRLAEESHSLYNSDGPLLDLITLLQPIAYLIVAFILVFHSEWCLKKLK